MTTKFQVIGKRDEIIDWLEKHRNVVCEYIHHDDQEFDCQKRGSTRSKRSTKSATERAILLFELYYDQENEKDSSHNTMIKKILPFSGKKRMVLEIRPYVRGEEYEYNKNLIRRNVGVSGVALRQILDVWTSTPCSRRQRNHRVGCDYE
ncbi:6008_t:CDS:2 [Racocetra fulgida]|uniref:6008_t:CDS:1 n=1 Tax=Racocetra fulgida TaxID=60492 RepID=A0A9N9BUL9_9GLOM|nr:6008_t:CDS:2 [Racocetra fulgida]